MDEGLISRRYARAIYFHASDRGEETLLYHRMQVLETLLRKMPEFRESLRSPLIPVNEKRILLTDATGRNPEQSYLDFINLVMANRRGDALLMISLSYQAFYRQKKKISVVHLTSAKKLSGKAIERIRRLTERQTHGKVEFSTRIDPAIDGGFIFQLNDVRIDASVKGQLNRIGRHLAQISKSIG
ncbi:MAG: F0F1 ATP synthase subunit delta [Tannerella sp.]|jgi:F-type H+-transporting ATPase subunit delta|nr:F0F1 ATP synthase subunit delta [Tannerella sp.]